MNEHSKSFFCELLVLILFFVAWGAMVYALSAAIGLGPALLIGGVLAGAALVDFVEGRRAE